MSFLQLLLLHSGLMQTFCLRARDIEETGISKTLVIQGRMYMHLFNTLCVGVRKTERFDLKKQQENIEN